MLISVGKATLKGCTEGARGWQRREIRRKGQKGERDGKKRPCSDQPTTDHGIGSITS